LKLHSTRAALALLLAGAILSAYWPSLHGGLLFDDETLISRNPLVQASDGLWRIWFSTDAIDYWPLTNSSFWLEWRLWGNHFAGYHITNVLLHITSVMLIWALLRRLAVPGAFLGAALFALHPVNVQSVAWIAQRKNTLALVFFLASILFFLKHHDARDRSGTKTSFWLSVTTFTLAMLSKGSVAVLPAILLVILWWRNGRVSRRDLIRIAPFAGIAVAFTLVNLWFQSRGVAPMRGVGPLERLLGAGAVIWFYLTKALVPIRLSFMYPQWEIRSYELSWWLPAAAAVAVTMVLWRARNRAGGRTALAVWLSFCVALVPVMGLTDVYFMKYSLVADHYQYIALIVVTASIGAALGSTARRFNGARVLAVGIIVALGAMTWRQAHLYADPETLYEATLKQNPSAWALENNLGALLIDRGRQEAAVPHLENALRVNPDLVAARVNRCLALVQLHRFEEGRSACGEAAGMYPDIAAARTNFGISLLASGRADEAAAEFRSALAIDPDDAEAHYNLAHVLTVSGRAREAIPHYRELLRLRPDSAVAHNGLGLALQETGDAPAAEAEFRAALALRPEFQEAGRNLDDLLRRTGR
jgi:protein O-mannosyl-transferase